MDHAVYVQLIVVIIVVVRVALDLNNFPGTLPNPDSFLLKFRHGPLAISFFVMFFSGPACLINTGDATSGRPVRTVYLKCRSLRPQTL